jgi:c-di-GMP-binding flagellar brake protein YcgR
MLTRAKRTDGLNGRGHPLRRRNVRIQCNLAARVETLNGSVRGLCTDLSLGGMLFVGQPVAVGEKINVTLDLLRTGSIRLQGEVLAHRELFGGAAMAIRFPELSQRDLAAINRFVAYQLA